MFGPISGTEQEPKAEPKVETEEEEATEAVRGRDYNSGIDERSSTGHLAVQAGQKTDGEHLVFVEEGVLRRAGAVHDPIAAGCNVIGGRSRLSWNAGVQ